MVAGKCGSWSRWSAGGRGGGWWCPVSHEIHSNTYGHRAQAGRGNATPPNRPGDIGLSEYTNLGKSLCELGHWKSIDFVSFCGTMVLLFLSEGVRFYDNGLFVTQGDGARSCSADTVKCTGDEGYFTYWHACF